MKRVLITGIGAGLLIAAVPFVTKMPEVATGWLSSTVFAQNPQQQQALELRLEAHKQVLTKDEQGKNQVTWQSLKDQAVVQPGNVLRYTLAGENKSDRQLKNITLNQPIPKGMIHILKSVNASPNTKVTYSIDGGKNFVENPTVKVTLANGQVVIQPAPASAYNHLRFQVPAIAAKQTVKVSYQTQVR